MLQSSVALVPAARLVKRNADADYPFRQNSNFLYLTGFEEPEALLVLTSKGTESQSILFCRNRDPLSEQWTGPRLGPERATRELALDAAYSITELESELPNILAGYAHLYFDPGDDQGLDQKILRWLGQSWTENRSSHEMPSSLISLNPLLSELRLHKSTRELEIMARAGQISALAHKRAMVQCRAGMSESRIEAELLHEFAVHGARWAAYTSIVGGGERACILHYVDNNQPLRDGDLLLIDAGCELAGYASDLTRTFPVNGRFSDAQKALYQVVLEAQLATIEDCVADVPYSQLQQTTDRKLTQGLLELGILTGELEELIETDAAKPFTLHKVGHWLGLDVHDVGSYSLNGQPRMLKPGMVTTVEPGIYIASDCNQSPPEFRGLGIRIEDSVAITENGPRILTGDVPKEVDEIERLMGS